MIPLLVLDLDGTLIGSDGKVSARIWEALDRYRTAGGLVSICTGRPNGGVAHRVAERAAPRGPHAFQNGAVIAYPDGRNVHVSALPERKTRAIVEHARDLGAVLELYTPTSLYVERKTPMSEAHAKMIGVQALVSDLLEVAAAEPVVRAQWVVTDELKPAIDAFELTGVQRSAATSPALPGTWFVSVTREGIDKGSAVERLAEAHGVDPADVMAVGDAENDAPMLERVGHPVVMGDAAAALLDAYPDVVAGVADAGVVDAVELAFARSPRRA